MIATPLDYRLLMPPRIEFGWGTRHQLGAITQTVSRRAWLTWGSRTLASTEYGEGLRASLQSKGIAADDLVRIGHEPTTLDVDSVTRSLIARGFDRADCLIAIGGGAAMDLTKAVAAMATNRAGDGVVDYLEGTGRNLSLAEPPLRWIAVPTTAGTGSEATKNAVISSPPGAKTPFKKSLRDDRLFAAAALVDPELTTSCPRNITLTSGLDAITQLIEAYITAHANAWVQPLIEAALPPALAAIRTAVHEPTSRWGREMMSHAALVSGVALANAGLGMAHGVAAPLGCVCEVTHGLACAVMLPVALRVNRPAVQDKLARLERIVQPNDTSDATAADAFVQRITDLCEDLGVPTQLGALGVTPSHVPQLLAASRGTMMRGNPVQLDETAITRLLESIL